MSESPWRWDLSSPWSLILRSGCQLSVQRSSCRFASELTVNSKWLFFCHLDVEFHQFICSVFHQFQGLHHPLAIDISPWFHPMTMFMRFYLIKMNWDVISSKFFNNCLNNHLGFQFQWWCYPDGNPGTNKAKVYRSPGLPLVYKTNEGQRINQQRAIYPWRLRLPYVQTGRINETRPKSPNPKTRPYHQLVTSLGIL